MLRKGLQDWWGESRLPRCVRCDTYIMKDDARLRAPNGLIHVSCISHAESSAPYSALCSCGASLNGNRLYHTSNHIDCYACLRKVPLCSVCWGEGRLSDLTCGSCYGTGIARPDRCRQCGSENLELVVSRNSLEVRCNNCKVVKAWGAKRKF